jgi:hypothetical protein
MEMGMGMEILTGLQTVLAKGYLRDVPKEQRLAKHWETDSVREPVG